MIALLDEWKHTSAYEIDGIIIANDSSYSITVKGNPAHAKAFKHNVLENAIETRVTRIEWNVSKDGKWKPVVQFEPIELEGVTIQRATGYNARFIDENRIGRDATVRIIRSGGVIPKIVMISKPSDAVELPRGKWDETRTELIVCPDDADDASGGESTTPHQTSSNTVASNYNENNGIILTTNQKILAKRIEHFVSTCDIEFYKEKLIQRGLVSCAISDTKDLLLASVDTFAKIDGVRDKMSEKIHTSVQSRAQTISLPVFLSALSLFPKIGVKKMSDLFEYENGEIYRRAHKHVHHRSGLTSMSLSDAVSDVDGFSNKSVATVVENIETMIKEVEWFIRVFPASNVAKTVQSYIENRPVVSTSTSASSGSSASASSSGTAEYSEIILRRVRGKTIVFSGFRDKELEEQLTAMGGRIGTRIRENSILVVKDIQRATTKVRDAMLTNSKVLQEDEFRHYVFHPQLHPSEQSDNDDNDVGVVDLTRD
jgi:NAD-dependent DNA ligase